MSKESIFSVTRVIRWMPPPPTCYKLNTDGSVENGQMFGGGVIRNSRGFFVAAFSVPLGRGVPIEAELMAALYGITFAHNNGWNNIWLESDSEFVGKLLQSDGRAIPWRIKSSWERFLIVKHDLTFFCTHILREANSVADYLAKLHIHSTWPITKSLKLKKKKS